jgi:hypothetical protein
MWGEDSSVEIIKSFQFEDKVVEIVIDPDPDNPRDWCNEGVLWAWSGRYRIGDGDVERQGITYYKDDFARHKFKNYNAVATEIYKQTKAIIVLPVYLYVHSGMCLSTSPFSCPFDSGQVGVIWMPRGWLEQVGYKRLTKRVIKQAEDILDSEIKALDAYLQGAVYGWRVYTNGELVDYCSGYYGGPDIPNMLKDALGDKAALEAVEIKA